MREMKIQGIIDLVESKTKEFMEVFTEYTTGTRVLLLIKRGKDGGHQNSEFYRRALRLISNSTHEYEKCLRIMLMLQFTTHSDHRVYATVNPQSLKNGEKALKIKMLEMDFGAEEQKTNFYERLEDRWVSSLIGSKAPKGEQKFIIDVDTKDDSLALNFCYENNIHIFRKYSTKNGWHIITEPFNSALLKPEVADLQKEGLLLIAY
jgi:hypothetical protein